VIVLATLWGLAAAFQTITDPGAPSGASMPVAPAGQQQQHHTGTYFDLWFERCDPAALERLLAADVNIVNAGGASSTRDQELRFYAERCGEAGFGTSSFPMRWEALPGTLKVHPVKDFGVLETGELRFLRRQNGVENELVRSRYLASWQRTEAGWLLKHLFLYDESRPGT
jgi:hypothetical protein